MIRSTIGTTHPDLFFASHLTRVQMYKDVCLSVTTSETLSVLHIINSSLSQSFAQLHKLLICFNAQISGA
jgi:hypothetical protein